MSTGLTYVFPYDTNSAEPLGVTGVQVFSDYSEAVEFCKWNARFVYAQIFGIPDVVRYTIWTSGPSQNGYINVAADPVFVAFD